MAHNISQVGGRAAIALAGNRPAWHGLGTVVSDAMTSGEALQLGGLADWQLQKLPQHVQIDDDTWIDTGSFAIVRRDHDIVLTQGTSVGDRYQIVANEELFDFLDEVMSELGAAYETVGALGNGEQVWLLARYEAGSFTVGGSGDDKIDSYLLLQSSHDGSASIQCYPTTVRVVCANTLRIAERRSRGGEQRYSMRHTKNVQRNIAEAIRVLGLASKSFSIFAEKAEAMNRKPVTESVLFDRWFNKISDSNTIAEVKVTSRSLVDGSIERAIDSTEPRELRVAFEKQFVRAVESRTRLIHAIDVRYDAEIAKGTLWGAFNAITEAIDHDDLIKYRGSSVARAESRFTSLISGKADAWKQLALESALELLAG